MTIKKLLMATAVAVPAALAFAAPAQAQVQGIATVDSTLAVARTKAFQAANQTIGTTFKSNFDQINAKEADRQKALAQLDKNGDKQVDDAELQAAQTAKNPALAQIQAIDTDINKLTAPPVLAQAYAIENILLRYQEAQKSVIAAKKISIILSPESFVYLPDAGDVTTAVTTELDRIAPTVSVTPPANWRPSRETAQVQQQIQQIQQYAMRVAAAQQAQQGGARPAAGAPAPAGTAPKPQTPPPGR